MSQENVDLALRAFEAVNRRALDAFLALMDDDVEVVTRIAAVEGGLHGHDGIRFWWENIFTSFPDFDSWRAFETEAEALEAVGLRG
jgi:hypothetical protein